VHAVFAAAAVFGLSLAGRASAQEAITIDVGALSANVCFGQASCAVDDASLSTSSGTLAQKDRNGASGFGVSGNPAGNEIGIGETLTVEVENARKVAAIQFLFLYNGSEFGSGAEKASVTADEIVYTLAVRNDVDNAEADWSGPGTVTKCGATTSQGTGCFIVTNPFPDAVSRLDFSAATAGQPFAGGGSSASDYAIGSIDIEAQIVFDLGDCAGEPPGCEFEPGFKLNSVHASNSGGSLETLAIPVVIPDCRYLPKTCLDLLPPANDTPAGNTSADFDAARATLINLGVIKSLATTLPNKLHPATQLFDISRLFSTEITTLFDESGGLPPLWIDSRWKAQSAKDHMIHGFFFKTESGVTFTDVFGGEINVLELTGSELGCNFDINDLTDFDLIATVSELAKSIAGQHVDTMINTGCINPTKVSGSRLSLYSILEITKDTYGPTIKSTQPLVTVNNDAVFARLVQSLWKDLGAIRADYACKQADSPTGGPAPLTAAQCKKLASLWSQVDNKIKLCIEASFAAPVSGKALGQCELARTLADDFTAALPANATGPDIYNRLGELEGRSAVFKHVWDTRFLNSIKASGFCREFGTCQP
jgi:hypothetical protein